MKNSILLLAAAGFAAGLVAQLSAFHPLAEQLGVMGKTAPDLHGRSLAQVETWARNQHVRVALDATRSGHGLPPGSVLGQVPRAGAKLSPGDVLHLTIASGPLAVNLPDETGLPADTAFKDLRARGLTPTATTVFDSRVAIGEVMRQVPAAHAPMSHGERVLLTVSGGPPRVAAPALDGLSEAEAARVLASHGIAMVVRGYTYDGNHPPGTVVQEMPAAGSLLPAHGQLVVMLNAGAAPARMVPNLVGMTLARAQAAAQAGGFALQVNNSTRPGGYFVVTSQSLPQGTDVHPDCTTNAQGQPVLKPVAVTVSVAAPQTAETPAPEVAGAGTISVVRYDEQSPTTYSVPALSPNQ